MWSIRVEKEFNNYCSTINNNVVLLLAGESNKMKDKELKKNTQKSYHYYLVNTAPATICKFVLATDNWSVKANRRKTTGIGRMRYLHHVPRRFPLEDIDFSTLLSGTEAAPRKKAAAAAV
ncbi:hypothetical protein ZIOFF_041802 [Zingiber officinale]|uniref:Uncharacterized protein n=1 Tax=Zingiber officinale TaxID=94328 RepID=A0A8J5G7I6_ZINOF|nr:hypothetical protein ZIOFF_041802 [Zingiber officinale]